MRDKFSDAIWVAVLTIFSQILGYVREMIFAYYLGTNIYLEAFQIAETIPLLFTQVLINAVPLALTPLLIKERQKGNDTLIHSAFAFWTGILIVICILIYVFPQQFISIVAPGFTGEIYEITGRLVITLVPNVLFLSLVALYNAFLNSHNCFKKLQNV